MTAPTFDAGAYDPPVPPLYGEGEGYMLPAHGWVHEAWGEPASTGPVFVPTVRPAAPFAPMPSYNPAAGPFYGVDVTFYPPHSVVAHRDQSQMQAPITIRADDYFPYDDMEAFDDPNLYETDL